MPRKTARQQTHQNEFKFKHNKGSRKTRKILSLPTTGLCLKCYEKIQWRKEYRKYKPLKTPKKCATCKEIKITQAYHVYCKTCADGKCEKCGLDRERDIIGRDEVRLALNERVKDLESSLTGIKERDRRKIIRELKDEIVNDRKSRRTASGEEHGDAESQLDDDSNNLAGDLDNGSSYSEDDDERDMKGDEESVLLKLRDEEAVEEDDEDSDDFAGLL